MSWQSYVEMLMTDKVKEAGIFGLEDGNEWACTDGLKNVTADQIKVLAADSSPMYACGPKIGTMKCVLIKDDRSNKGSKCMHLKTSQQNGNLPVCVGTTKTALVIVIGSDTDVANKLTKPVHNVVSYLSEKNI